MEFVSQLKNAKEANTDSTQSMFLLTILEKILKRGKNSLKEVQQSCK